MTAGTCTIPAIPARATAAPEDLFNASGGPLLHDGYIVGVNSFVLNLNCKGPAFAYRVDTAYAQDFITSHA
jgi:hypothetical protein